MHFLHSRNPKPRLFTPCNGEQSFFIVQTNKEFLHGVSPIILLSTSTVHSPTLNPLSFVISLNLSIEILLHVQKKRNKVVPGNYWDIECYASRIVGYGQIERLCHPSQSSAICGKCLVKLEWCLFQLLQGPISSWWCWGEISHPDKGSFYKCHWLQGTQ